MKPIGHKSLGQVAYEAYGDSTGWLTFTGQPMKDWLEQEPRLREAWEQAGHAIRNHLRLRGWRPYNEVFHALCEHTDKIVADHDRARLDGYQAGYQDACDDIYMPDLGSEG